MSEPLDYYRSFNNLRVTNQLYVLIERFHRLKASVDLNYP